MRLSRFISFGLALALPISAHANIILLANGQLNGATDLSGLGAPMENGLPGNILGGIGSGLAYAGGNMFFGLPDRGPNATPYNSAIDDTVSYIPRFQTLSMVLTPNAPGSTLPYSLSPTLMGTTLLYSPNALTYGSGAGLGVGSGAPSINDGSHFYFSGRSDNFGPGLSTDPANARFDPESIRLSNDGKNVFISDEYGPYIRQFDRATGQLIKTFSLPGDLASPNLSPKGDVEITGNIVGRTANKGMEGLAITPDGKTLVGMMQAPLTQDAANSATSKMVRIVTVDIATGTTHEYGYMLTKGSGVSEILAINDHQFLVDERDGKGLGDGSDAKVKQFFIIDINGATDITGLTGAAAAASPVSKSASPFVDLVSALTALGIPKSQIPAKIEGMTFGQDIVHNGELLHTLYIANDNDFLPNIAGPNQFYVFGFSDKDLPGFLAQNISAVPEPASWAMMLAGFGFLGATLRRKRKISASLRLA